MSDMSMRSQAETTLNVARQLMVVWIPQRRPVFGSIITLQEIADGQYRPAWRVDRVAEELARRNQVEIHR